MNSEFKPSIIDRALCAIAPRAGLKRLAARAALHQFGYDAARSTSRRSQAPQQIAPNTSMLQRDRMQLMREAIDLENNFAPAKTLNRKYAMYVAPQGYNAATGDGGLDKEVEEYLNTVWFPNCDVTGRYGFYQLMEFAVMGMNRAGDFGFAIVRPGLEDGMETEDANLLDLRIQGIEADRLGGLYQTQVAQDYVGGIGIGEHGQPTFYRVYKRGTADGQYTDPVDIPASNFVHYMDPMQCDYYRGISKLDTACTAMRDTYELIEFIKAKAKLASALTVFTNSNGASVGGGGFDAYSTTIGNGRSISQQDILYGQINHLPDGADIKFPDTASPGPETQYMLKLLMKLMAMSYNLPYSFALDATDLGGVSTRLESEQAKAEFDRGQKILIPKADKLKNAALMDAMAKGILPMNQKIFSGRWSFRPHPQPDIGKEASAAVSLYQQGLLNPLKYWNDDAQDPENVAAAMVKWHQIKDKAVEGTGYKVEDVFGSGPAMPMSISESTSEEATPATEPKAFSTKQLKKKAPAARPKRTELRNPSGRPRSGGLTERNETVAGLIPALTDVLPHNQAIAAAYKIVDKGKLRPGVKKAIERMGGYVDGIREEIRAERYNNAGWGDKKAPDGYKPKPQRDKSQDKKEPKYRPGSLEEALAKMAPADRDRVIEIDNTIKGMIQAEWDANEAAGRPQPKPIRNADGSTQVPPGVAELFTERATILQKYSTPPLK